MRSRLACGFTALLAAGCGAGTTGEGGEPRNNQPPIADAGGDQTSVSTTQQLALDGTQSFDPEGRSITYSWAIESEPAGSNAPLLNAGSAHATLVPDTEGTYYIRLVVNDGYRDSDPDLIQVVVDNSAPEAEAGDDRTMRTNCGQVELNGTQSSDPNGDSLQYAWSFVTRPNGSNATILDPSANVTGFIPDVPGAYRVKLVVSDGQIDSLSSEFNVDVAGDVARNGNVLVVNNLAPFDVLSFDPDGGYLGKFADGAAIGVTAWRNLYGVTQRANGEVLVSAAVSQRVFKLSSTGSFLGEWSTAYSNGNLSLPQGLFESPGGDVLVVTFRSLGVGRHAIQEFTSGGTFQGDFKLNASLSSPRNVILACDGDYLVTNSGAGTVDRYDGQSFDYLGPFATVSSATGISQLQDGTILVSRFQSNDVQKLSPKGQALGGFTGAGSGLSAPSGVWVLGNGNVVVTSTGNDRVKLFNSTGGLIGDLGSGAPLTDPIGVVQLR